MLAMVGKDRQFPVVLSVVKSFKAASFACAGEVVLAAVQFAAGEENANTAFVKDQNAKCI
jgi:hypothetical protein